MDTYLKFSSQTAGKDKLARLIQYSSKLLAYLIERIRIGRIDLADQLKHLEYHFGTFRKLLRLGKSLEVLYGVLKTLRIHDATLRSLITQSRIAQSIFLVADHMIWVGRTGLVKVNAEKWRNMSNRCWIYSITLNLLRDLYEIKQFCNQVTPASTAVCQKYSSNSLVRYALLSAPLITSCCIERKDIVIDTVKNICDIFIPLSSQGHVNINSGVVGFLGMISSLAGILALIDPSAKISPS